MSWKAASTSREQAGSWEKAMKSIVTTPEKRNPSRRPKNVARRNHARTKIKTTTRHAAKKSRRKRPAATFGHGEPCMSGREDSNLRPPEPHSGALAKLRHAPMFGNYR